MTIPAAAATAPLLAAAAAAGTGILVGAAMVATRAVIAESDAASLALMRYVLGSAFLLPPLLLSRRVRIPPRDLLPICLLGILQFGILIALLNWGLQFIGSARGSVIFSVMPLLAMMIAALIGVERLSWQATLGVVASMGGVALTLADKLGGGPADVGHWWGEIAVFVSALCGALCSVYYRPYLQRYPTLQVSFVAMLASVAFLAVPAAWEGFFSAWPQISSAGWACVGFIGLASSLGYYLWLYALRHSTPTRATIFQSLGPITATALGWALLDERITVLFLAGLVCVCGGLWLALRPRPSSDPS